MLLVSYPILRDCYRANAFNPKIIVLAMMFLLPFFPHSVVFERGGGGGVMFGHSSAGRSDQIKDIGFPYHPGSSVGHFHVCLSPCLAVTWRESITDIHISHLKIHGLKVR